MTTIDYYFSLNSPWTFLGGERFAKMAKAAGAEVNCVPVNLGSVFAETGGLPLGQRSKERQAYRMMEMKRWKAFHDIPLVLEPKNFPHDESEGVRLVLAAKKSGGDALGLSIELLRALWELDQDPTNTAVQDEAAKRAGLDAATLRDVLTLEEAKAEWTSASENAIAKGIFAAPSYVIDGEIFWGQDRLDFVERKLAS